MNAQQSLRKTIDISQMVIDRYLDDLTDADLMRRPSPNSNHLAWQLGHLIASEAGLVNAFAPGKGDALPPGFAEAHAKTTTGVDDPAKFCTKEQYAAALKTVRAATLAVLETLTDADFDQPAPESMRKMFPTVGDHFTLIATHFMMHAGQIAVVRRQLGKPIVI